MPLADYAEGLPGVTTKRMFGHETLFVGGQIFALLANGGRVGVRLPEPEAHAEAAALAGASPFDPMGRGKGMSHWVILPESLLDDEPALRGWVRRAHGLALAGEPETKKVGRPTTKKAAAKRPARR